MSDFSNIYEYIYTLPLGLRSFIWISVFVFISLISILSAKKIQIIYGMIYVIKFLLITVYVIVCWVLLAPFQKIFGGFFESLINLLSDVFEYCDSKISEFLKKTRTKWNLSYLLNFWPLFSIGIILVILIAIPDLFKLGDDANIRVFEKYYLKAEMYVFGEAVPTVKNSKAEESLEKEEPIKESTIKKEETILVIVSKIKRDSSLNLRSIPSAESKSIYKFYFNDTLYYLGETIENEGELWAHVKNKEDLEGWVRQKYLEGIPSE